MNKQQNRLVLDNVGLAYSFAETYKWHSRYDDIKQSCLLGLCEAASRWDGKAAFSTYAYYWMRHCSGVELKDTGPILDPEVYEVLRASDAEEFLMTMLHTPRVREVLLRLVHELPKNERHAVLLKYPLDSYSKAYTDVDIAVMLGCSTTWVGNLRRKAFRTLGKRLVKEGL